MDSNQKLVKQFHPILAKIKFILFKNEHNLSSCCTKYSLPEYIAPSVLFYQREPKIGQWVVRFISTATNTTEMNRMEALQLLIGVGFYVQKTTFGLLVLYCVEININNA